eukprot:TRINITY_DN6914_c0_g1_i2.p1 TRINITY_DN6914_c0_g1~~TRINITY_DN6914_c0_g1_i2.p1  ORF type:complete len:839 (-),score=128.71 TRINITY_DN6914_c0_g1_i2:264-2780(-)
MNMEPLLGCSKTETAAEENGTWRSFLHEHRSDWLALILGPAISVPFAACYAALVCCTPTLQPYFPVVMQQIMWTNFAGAVLSTFMGQFITTSNMDPLVAILFGQMAKRSEILFRGEPAAYFPNMILLMPLMTGLLGLALYSVGRLRLAFMLRFFPYTVTGGFLAGSGLLILMESMKLAAGCEVWHLVYATFRPNSSLHASRLVSNWSQLLVACLYSYAAGVAREAHTFGTPALLVFCVLSSICVEQASGGVFPPRDWFLSFPDGVSPLAPFQNMAQGVLMFEPSKSIQVELALTFVTIMTVSWSINTLAIKKLVPLRRGVQYCDDQAEIQSLGLMNICLAALGGHASMQSFKIPMMMREVKSGDLWPVFSLAMSLVFFIASPRVIVQTVPRFLFAGTVIRLASDLIIEWLVEAQQRISRNEWWILALTALAIAVNLSLGVLVGLFMTLVHSAIEYSGITGVVRSSSLREVTSNVERSREEMSLLRQHGQSVQILWLSGYMFFGSVEHAMDEVRRTLEDSQVRIMVLDFSMVPAMDASGVYALIDVIEELRGNVRGARLVLCGLVRRLDLALRNAAEHKGTEAIMFHNLDLALEWCEAQQLDTLTANGSLSRTRSKSRTLSVSKIDSAGNITGMLASDGEPSFEDLWAKILKDNLQELDPERSSIRALQKIVKVRNLLPGQVAFRFGDHADEILVLVKGSIEVMQPPKAEASGMHLHLPRHHLNTEKGDVYVFEERRTRRVRRGAIFGAIEYVVSCSDEGSDSDSDEVRLRSTGTAVDEVQLYVLSYAALRDLERREQLVALVLRTWLSRLAAEAVVRGGVHMGPMGCAAGNGLKRQLS